MIHPLNIILLTYLQKTRTYIAISNKIKKEIYIGKYILLNSNVKQLIFLIFNLFTYNLIQLVIFNL